MADAPDVHIKGDDKLTRLLDSVEKVEERLAEVDGLKDQLSGYEQSFAENKARLEKLEDSGNSHREFTSKHGDSFDRKRALGEWASDIYKMTFTPGYERASGDVQTGTTNADGGFLVPELVAPEVIRIVERAGIARSLCRVMPMGGDTVHLTNRDVSGGKGVKTLWPGEGSAPTEDKEEFTRVSLNAKKLVGLTPVSDELLGDSAVDFANYLLEVFSEAIAKEEDKQVLNSTTPFTGILDTSGVGTVDAGASFTNLDYSDVVNLQHAVDASLIDNGTFVFHPSMGQHLRNIKDTQGNPIWSMFAGAPQPTILGRPYAQTTQMPSTDASGAKYLLYGDFSHCAFGVRDSFSVAFSSEAGFKEGNRWMRVSERIAVAVCTAGAFAYAHTT